MTQSKVHAEPCLSPAPTLPRLPRAPGPIGAATPPAATPPTVRPDAPRSQALAHPGQEFQPVRWLLPERRAYLPRKRPPPPRRPGTPRGPETASWRVVAPSGRAGSGGSCSPGAPAVVPCSASFPLPKPRGGQLPPPPGEAASACAGPPGSPRESASQAGPSQPPRDGNFLEGGWPEPAPRRSHSFHVVLERKVAGTAWGSGPNGR